MKNIFEIKELLQQVYSEFDFGMNETVEIGADHALLARSGSKELAQLNISIYKTIETGEWQILVPQHLVAQTIETIPTSAVAYDQSVVMGSAKTDMAELQEGAAFLTQLKSDESLEDFMARPYYANPVNSIYFIGFRRTFCL